MDYDINSPPPYDAPLPPVVALPVGTAERQDPASLAKLALVDSWQTLRIALREPVDGTQRTWEHLSEPRKVAVTATYTGALMLAFAIGLGGLINSLLGAIRDMMVSVLGMFGAGIPAMKLGMGHRVGLAFAALLIIAGIFVTSTGFRRVYRVPVAGRADLFLAALATVPITLFLLPVGILGISSPVLVVPLATLALCYSVLLLYGGFRGVAGLSEARAAMAVPAAYIVTNMLLYICFSLLIAIF
ncbi:MAG: hypothetical protein H0X65_10535 [Gemmatimonadetes bacterium]|nr:hypothetical protein [Gemmatimonadota bacterium]